MLYEIPRRIEPQCRDRQTCRLERGLRRGVDRLGQVQGVAIDSRDHHVPHGLLQAGPLWGSQKAIPIGAVRSVKDRNHLNVNKQEAQGYRARASSTGARSATSDPVDAARMPSQLLLLDDACILTSITIPTEDYFTDCDDEAGRRGDAHA